MDNIYNLTYDNLTYDDTELNCEHNLSFIAIINQILYSVVFIVGLLGNTLVIYVILCFAGMQTVTNMYIVNLAIADECFLLGIPFLVTTISLRDWIFGNIMCKVYMITTSINQFTSSIFLLIMSADRYIAVCHPISSPKMRTPFISKIISLSAWVTSVLLMTPIFLYANTKEYIDGTVSCNIYWPNDHGGHITFTFYMFILSFVVPLIFIVVFYSLVIKKLRTVGPKNKSKEKKESHRKVSRLVLTVIVVYVFCWLPYWVTQVALIYTPPKKCQTNIGIATFLLAGFLSYSNSAMNPILYAFLSDNFKKSFVKACCAKKDTNAILNNENSVFPRKKINRLQRDQIIADGSSRMDFDNEETDRGFLSKTSTTTVTMTSRSNIEITVSSDYKDSSQRNKDLNKNDAQVTLSTQV
ncbi:PREDICTED: somatostatin receptor type 2-like [Cyphomyrmex costatus]|nr:PREDICTED: somatostatin receptor type 2-like [Cyphomyrmex costatus]